MRFLFLLVIASLLPGCETPPEEEAYLSPAIFSTPLEHDPTQKFELGQWWSNGEDLLRLKPDSSFTLFDTINQYHEPAQRGWWAQQTYAYLLLDPYTLYTNKPIRVSITRMKGELMLIIPDHRPMFSIEHPPAMIEDGLFGKWSGPLGDLKFNEDMRYEYSPKAPPEGDQIVTAGHRGRWILKNNQIRLLPDIVNLGPFSIKLLAGDEELILSTPEGEFLHAEDEAYFE